MATNDKPSSKTAAEGGAPVGTEMGGEMILARDLTKRYGKFTAVDGIDLDVAEGEVYGFLGPNGAGKTTTLRMLTGVIKPTRGTIRIAGFDLAKDPIEAKRLTSLIPDRPYLYEKLTAVEFLRFVGGLYKMAAKDCARRIEHTLDLFDLSDWGGSLIENFSHGMKQRLVFAAALLPRPRLLVVDEPMVGLDPRGARLVKTVFRQLRDEENATVLLSTHTMQVAEELCDRISVIHKGQIIATGTLEELRRAARRADEPAHDLEAIFLILTREASRASKAPTLAESASAGDAQAGPTEDSTP